MAFPQSSTRKAFTLKVNPFVTYRDPQTGRWHTAFPGHPVYADRCQQKAA